MDYGFCLKIQKYSNSSSTDSNVSDPNHSYLTNIFAIYKDLVASKDLKKSMNVCTIWLLPFFATNNKLAFSHSLYTFF